MKVLFICTGNTCRSVMAEAIFNNLCSGYNESVSSTGLSGILHSLVSEKINPYGRNVDIYTETFFELKNKIDALIDKI